MLSLSERGIVRGLRRPGSPVGERGERGEKE